MKATEKTSVTTNRKPTGRYASVEAFRQAKVHKAVEATKHIDWDKLRLSTAK